VSTVVLMSLVCHDIGRFGSIGDIKAGEQTRKVENSEVARV